MRSPSLNQREFDFCVILARFSDSTDAKLTEAVASWDEFERNRREIGEWLTQYELALRNQQLQSTADEKEAVARRYREHAETMARKRAQVEAFVDANGELVANSASAAAKSALEQIKDRFRAAYAQIEQAAEKWSTMGETHRRYDTKLVDMNDGCASLERSFGELTKSRAENLVTTGEQLRELVATRDKMAAGELSELVALGESLLADTAADGREQVRKNLRELRDRLVIASFSTRLGKNHKNSLFWLIFREEIMEKCLGNDPGEIFRPFSTECYSFLPNT